MKGFRFIFGLVLTFSFLRSGHASECKELVNELNSMRRAQQAMLDGLSSNHELFAITLESYSDALTQTAGKVHKVVSSNMNETSKSFRQRGQSAKLGAEKLNRATAEIIVRLQKCLK